MLESQSPFDNSVLICITWGTPIRDPNNLGQMCLAYTHFSAKINTCGKLGSLGEEFPLPPTSPR